jgi:proteic killer suppression protein
MRSTPRRQMGTDNSVGRGPLKPRRRGHFQLDGSSCYLIRIPYQNECLRMIRSFACKDTERIWQGWSSRKFPGGIQERALRKLRQLDASLTLEDLRNPPGKRLEVLKGDRAGQWSIRINGQWRICFRWNKGEANDVEIVDYH